MLRGEGIVQRQLARFHEPTPRHAALMATGSEFPEDTGILHELGLRVGRVGLARWLDLGIRVPGNHPTRQGRIPTLPLRRAA